MSKRRNVSIGDVCLMDDGSKRGDWPIGIIEDATVSEDGHVRSVAIRLGNGSVYRRPISKIVVIQRNETEDQEEAK